MPNDWKPVKILPQLEPGQLHLWRVDLMDGAADPERYTQHLSPGERNRASRLRAGQVRMQFIVARACLRVLLGDLLNLTPDRVPITLTSYGRPETPPAASGPIHFNVAHARDTVLIALCRSCRVGIDLEYPDRDTEVLEIARTSFTPHEFRQIEQASDPDERRSAFFRCWTRKEAVIKADGRGLSLPLDAVEVPVSASALSTPVLIPNRENTALLDTWFVTDLPLGDITGAFAASIPDLELCVFRFPLDLL